MKNTPAQPERAARERELLVHLQGRVANVGAIDVRDDVQNEDGRMILRSTLPTVCRSSVDCIL